MRLVFAVTLAFAVAIGISTAVDSDELDVKKFLARASKRYFKTFDTINEELYQAQEDEDYADIDKILRFGQKLALLSKEGQTFDFDNIKDEEQKKALKEVIMAADIYILDDVSDYKNSLKNLKELSWDKDIVRYNSEDENDKLAFYPDIINVFKESKDVQELEYYWNAWREMNKGWASSHLLTLMENIKSAAETLDVSVRDFWYRHSSSNGVLSEWEKILTELKPFYEQIHAFLRQELHKKYGDEVNPNGPIPDHFYQQLLQQTWSKNSILEEYFQVHDLPPYNSFVDHLKPLDLYKEAEKFFTSLGFQPLGEEFYENYIQVTNDDGDGDCRGRVFDRTENVRTLYCDRVDFKKFMQAHGQMTRIYYAHQKKGQPSYYFDSYNLEYAVGEAVVLSASTPNHLNHINITGEYKFTNESTLNRLFRMGIHTFLNIPQYYVHARVWNDLLTGEVPYIDVNKHYWQLMEKYVGVEPPTNRPKEVIDLPYKFFLDIDGNQERFASEILGYQFYKAFCKKTAYTGELHLCDFAFHEAVGENLKQMMSLGSSKSWTDVIATVLPENQKLSIDALTEYYQPIFDWLKAKNADTKVKTGWNASEKSVE